jgi:hypothetical protein
MRNDSFKRLSSLLYGLGGVKFFLLGLLADGLMAGGLFALFWIFVPIDSLRTWTVSEYLRACRDILEGMALLFIWLWPFCAPVFAAPPLAGLWVDLRKFASKD